MTASSITARGPRPNPQRDKGGCRMPHPLTLSVGSVTTHARGDPGPQSLQSRCPVQRVWCRSPPGQPNRTRQARCGRAHQTDDRPLTGMNLSETSCNTPVCVSPPLAAPSGSWVYWWRRDQPLRCDRSRRHPLHFKIRQPALPPKPVRRTRCHRPASAHAQNCEI